MKKYIIIDAQLPIFIAGCCHRCFIEQSKSFGRKTKPSVASIKKSIVQYGSRQLSDFDKYKALERVEELKNAWLIRLKIKNPTISLQFTPYYKRDLAKPPSNLGQTCYHCWEIENTIKL